MIRVARFEGYPYRNGRALSSRFSVISNGKSLLPVYVKVELNALLEGRILLTYDKKHSKIKENFFEIAVVLTTNRYDRWAGT